MLSARSLALGVLAFAIAALAAPAVASAIYPGPYRGEVDRVTTEFFVPNDQTVEDLRVSRRCGAPECTLASRGSVPISDRGTVEFPMTNSDGLFARVKFQWANTQNAVTGTVESAIFDEGKILMTETPIEASLKAKTKPGAGAGAADGASPAAFFAATRPEYVSRLDPICQSYEKPALKLVGRYFKQTAGVRKAQSELDPAVAERRLLGPFGSLLRGIDKVVGKLTTQIAAVPAPAGDELAVAQWLAGRRAYRRAADRAAAAGKVGSVGKLFTLLGRASTRFADGEQAVAGFGFQSCIG
jgi:hypothetical protein